MALAVGFDFDHTLGVDNKLERTVAMDLLAQRAKAAGVAFQAQVALRETESTLLAYRSGAATFGVAWASLSEKILGSGEDPQTFVEEFAQRCVLAVPQYVKALPGANDLLAALREQKIPYALLTNGWSPLQECKAEAIGFASTVLVSERIGARKPDAAAFDRLVGVFGVARSDVLYVGDDPRNDVAGSQAAGLTGVWFDWESVAYPSDCPPPNHTVHALSAVLPLLVG